MTGAQLLIRCLEQEGVRDVFGVPGEETLGPRGRPASLSIRQGGPPFQTEHTPVRWNRLPAKWPTMIA